MSYEIPEQHLFWGLPGRYSQADFAQVDAYAQDLGIELVPCADPGPPQPVLPMGAY